MSHVWGEEHPGTGAKAFEVPRRFKEQQRVGRLLLEWTEWRIRKIGDKVEKKNEPRQNVKSF